MSAGKDLFGAEPFDPFTCGAADFPPDIQSKLDEMQVSVPSVHRKLFNPFKPRALAALQVLSTTVTL